MSYTEQQAVRRYDAGSLIFREGDSGSSMFIIQSGTVKIHTQKNNQDVKLALLQKGNIFGEMTVIDQRSRSASASAVDGVVCLEISQMLFQNSLDTIPKWMQSFFKILVERIRIANSKAMTASEIDVSHQIVLMMDNQFRLLGHDQHDEIAIPWKPLVSEIALRLQLANDTVDKRLNKITMSSLATIRITDQHQRMLVLEDKNKFFEYAKYCRAQLEKNRGKSISQQYQRADMKLLDLLTKIEIIMKEQSWSPEIEFKFLESRFNDENRTVLDDYKSELKMLMSLHIIESKPDSDGKIIYTIHKDALYKFIQTQKTLEEFKNVKL